MADDRCHSGDSPSWLLPPGQRHLLRPRKDRPPKGQTKSEDCEYSPGRGGTGPLRQEGGFQEPLEVGGVRPLRGWTDHDKTKDYRAASALILARSVANLESETNSDDKKRSLLKKEDEMPELVLPSVRSLVCQFDRFIRNNSNSIPVTKSGCRTKGSSPAFTDGQRQPPFAVKAQDIGNRVESKKRDEPTRMNDSCLCRIVKEHCKCMVDYSGESGGGFTREFRSRGMLFRGVEPREYCSVESLVPKNFQGDLNALTEMGDPQTSEEQKSLSDSNLCWRESDNSILAHLDSGTSDLSLEGCSFSPKSWSRGYDNSTKEHNRRSSLALSLYPLVFPSPDAVKGMALRRSRSCEFLSGSSDGKGRRPNSPDSAVVVEDESKGPHGSHRSSLSLPSFTMTEEILPDASPTNPDPDSDPSSAVVLRRDSTQKTARTPSVVISDHSNRGVSFHVAYASDDFPFNCILRSPPLDAPYQDICFCRKASECSTCSTASTVDSSEWLVSLCDFSTGSLPQRRLSDPYNLQRRFSDCSTCSYLTGSEDEVEVTLAQPSPPPLRKNSNWKKVRNVVQWTPFIQTYKRQKYPWVQLAGHQGNFKAGHRQGSIMKKLCPAEEKAFETLQHDALQSFVPEYMGIVEGSDGDKYLQLQDLLSNFTSPCVMDIKMGVRTYLEEELAKARHKPKLRKDMYEKMIQIDPKAPTEPENRAKAVTKPRYMVWRETISSTATLGFRIEGVRRGDGSSSKDFKTTRTRDQVMTALASFVDRYSEAVVHYIDRLKEIKFTLEKSTFFKTHELIGSSLLFVHNAEKSGVWLIDFAKTIPLPDSVKTTHRVPWVEGTHEDGYLIGLENLIDIFEGLDKNTLSKGETTHINQADKIVPNAQKDALSLLTNAKTNEEANTESVPNSSPKISPVTKSLSLKEAQSETFTQGAQMHSSVTKTQSFAMGSGGALYMHTKNKNVAGVIERKCLTSQGTEKKAN